MWRLIVVRTHIQALSGRDLPTFGPDGGGRKVERTCVMTAQSSSITAVSRPELAHEGR